jgi:Tubulin/FtsZ family, GTPase domain
MQLLPEGGMSPCNIKVIGVGGGGSNAVKRMMETYIEGVEFWSLNTDVQALARIQNGARTMTIGNTITRGLGAGGVPDIGRRAAEESRQQIAEIVAGADLVFVTAGMGGGTGSGAAPVVAEVKCCLLLVCLVCHHVVANMLAVSFVSWSQLVMMLQVSAVYATRTVACAVHTCTGVMYRVVAVIAS